MEKKENYANHLNEVSILERPFKVKKVKNDCNAFREIVKRGARKTKPPYDYPIYENIFVGNGMIAASNGFYLIMSPNKSIPNGYKYISPKNGKEVYIDPFSNNGTLLDFASWFAKYKKHSKKIGFFELANIQKYMNILNGIVYHNCINKDKKTFRIGFSFSDSDYIMAFDPEIFLYFLDCFCKLGAERIFIYKSKFNPNCPVLVFEAINGVKGLLMPDDDSNVSIINT